MRTSHTIGHKLCRELLTPPCERCEVFSTQHISSLHGRIVPYWKPCPQNEASFSCNPPHTPHYNGYGQSGFHAGKVLNLLVKTVTYAFIPNVFHRKTGNSVRTGKLVTAETAKRYP